MNRFLVTACLGVLTNFAASATAADPADVKDILNYSAQRAAGKDIRKIVLIGDKRTHGPKGNHEFVPGAIYLARTLNAFYPNCYATVHPHTQWPKDLSHADAVVILLNNGGPAVNPAVEAAMKRGAGFMAIHYGVECSKGKQGDAFLDWMGGYFEAEWSVNPWWTPNFAVIPEHETTRGVKPFAINDEWYYHMRFVKDMKGVTPILTAVAPLDTVKGGGTEILSHGGNPTVYKEVAAGIPQHMAWAYVRPNNARGFGLTGYHRYENLQNDNFRTILLNATAWTAKLEVPANGIPSKTPTTADLDAMYTEGLRIGK